MVLLLPRHTNPQKSALHCAACTGVLRQCRLVQQIIPSLPTLVSTALGYLNGRMPDRHQVEAFYVFCVWSLSDCAYIWIVTTVDDFCLRPATLSALCACQSCTQHRILQFRWATVCRKRPSGTGLCYNNRCKKRVNWPAREAGHSLP